MDHQDGARRLLLVHAHPDDESIGTGATIARYAAEGAHVTLVTCTLGELGEVIPPDLACLAGDGDRLGAHRITELAAACAALGITDQRFLGGPGRWRDSGMMGLPANDSPDCFWRADVPAAAAELARILREVRPQVLVSYDENGFYGHPDHIQAHRVAWRAFELADGLVRKFYATAVPKSVLAEGIRLMREGEPGGTGRTPNGPGGSGAAGSGGAESEGAESGAAGSEFQTVESVDDLPFGVPDEQVTTEIDARDYLDAKLEAMRAHASQIAVDSPFFALSDRVARLALGVEYYTLVAGPRGPGGGSAGWESDLFAGLG